MEIDSLEQENGNTITTIDFIPKSIGKITGAKYFVEKD